MYVCQTEKESQMPQVPAKISFLKNLRLMFVSLFFMIKFVN